MKQHFLRGFTLIELMLVVAIIGILASIAIPQYQDYLSRSRWSDNFIAAGQLKQAIAECMQDRGMQGLAVAPCESTANLVANGFLPTGYVDPPLRANFGAVAYAGGVIAYSGGSLTGTNLCTVTLTPTANMSLVTWSFMNTAAAVCNRTKTGVGT